MIDVTRLPPLPHRAADAHKGDFGRVLVVAGSRGMSGAAVLCASAALRGGAGLVTAAIPESCWPIVAAGNPCVMTLPLPDAGADRAVMEAAAKADVVVAGPGLGRDAHIAAIVQSLMASDRRLVLDADALNSLDCPPDSLTKHRGDRVLTPHPGEFARLIGTSIADVQSRRETVTREFVERFGGVLVLKGHGTLVADANQIYRNTTGNPGMATAGSGDVLGGLIGALMGQGMKAFPAAQLGVYLHGLTGDLAAAKLGQWSLTAADLLDYLPRAFLAHVGSTATEGS